MGYFDVYTNWHNISTNVKDHTAFFDAQTYPSLYKHANRISHMDRMEITNALLSIKLQWRRSQNAGLTWFVTWFSPVTIVLWWETWCLVSLMEWKNIKQEPRMYTRHVSGHEPTKLTEFVHLNPITEFKKKKIFLIPYSEFFELINYPYCWVLSSLKNWKNILISWKTVFLWNRIKLIFYFITLKVHPLTLHLRMGLLIQTPHIIIYFI